MRRAVVLLTLVVLVVATPAAARLPPAPPGWGRTVVVGLADQPGGAAALARRPGIGARYQYLAGGVNTGAGWSTWNPGGAFASLYADESRRHGLRSVLTYYMLLQSSPALGGEAQTDLAHLRDDALMRAYYRDFSLLLRRLRGREDVVVHVEPDLWGYAEQAARRDDARTVPAAVASTGRRDLRGLPNDVSGFARALVRLRDHAARNVRLAYHVSVWGTKIDIQYADPPAREVDRLAARVARFERSLHAPFDLLFAEFSDRDAGFKRVRYGDGGASFWNAADFARHVRFLRGVVARTARRVVLWQIPLGNMRLDDTEDHYRDNRVEWLLGDRGLRHLRAYARAGVIGLLFGGGADGTTSARTDGGYFFSRAGAYARARGVPLPRSGQ